jgi:6-phosphofructokinase 1
MTDSQKTRKTIGVLTSGGDAPGMNAAVRAVVRTGINRGFFVVGIKRGFSGLLENDMDEMSLRSVSNIMQRGGTILYSSRSPEFKEQRNVKKAVANCKNAGIDALVAIGGDGTFRGSLELCRNGMPCIGIPATIDNDIAATEYTIGFDTAVNTVVEMVDRVRDTAASHNRCSVIEVMGRDSGHIALHAGIACGAIAIAIPEIEFDLERDVIPKMVTTLRNGKKNFIIIVAEGVGNAQDISKRIQSLTGINTAAVVLGYVQRGGTPSAKERVMASAMGHHSVGLIEKDKVGRLVVVKNGLVTDLDMESAMKMEKSIDMDLVRVAGEISI